ncbi:MAG: glycosyltransferase [Gemmatimonadota bacterium]|nr:glycosyltransferase [Gemmatimonadota bacterium]
MTSTVSRSSLGFPPVQIKGRVVARGKFLYVDGKKFYIRGVTYGPLSPDESGNEYKSESDVSRDFAAMAAAGVNLVRTHTAVPRWLLDCAERAGLRVLVGCAWEQHITFLDDRQTRHRIEKSVRDTVRSCARHRAVLGFAIGNEIPASIVRWYGAVRIERFIEGLYRIAKHEDPEALVTYVNYPTTEYLQLPFVDFYCYNVYLEKPGDLAAYIARLQNIASDKPLVLGELGLDSESNGRERQASTLDWQIRATFSGGCAGVCIFSWTDEWFRGGQEIEGWGFGLTDRDGNPKPARDAVAKAFAEVPFPVDAEWPRVTVVVCTYNGVRHIRETCEALSRLDYPDYEVVVVSDGSTDGTLEVLADFDVKVIAVENGGLSRARNLGLQAATGQIIAYLDDDAYPDEHWLKYLAWAFRTTMHVGIGGPNIPPIEDGFWAQCVAHSPGGPNHVLLADQLAEHIPGCNMAFRKWALDKVGGFDMHFRIAGDDVDVCWRIQEQVGTLGFSPAAVVWHHRRNSVSAYLRQQFNYGRAEAMLATKWPRKFNTAGHVTWGGRLYGTGRSTPVFSTHVKIYQGTWGTSAFQSIYQQPSGVLGSLPQMPEWHLLVGALVVVSLLGLVWTPLLIALIPLVPALLAPVAQSVRGAAEAELGRLPRTRLFRWRARLIIAVLHYLQPITRLRGRLIEGLHPWRWRRKGLSFFGFRKYAQWQENWLSSELRLVALETLLHQYKARTMRGGDFDRWDLQVRGGALGSARVLMAIEEHGAGRQLVRYRIDPKFSRATWSLVAVVGALAWFAMTASDLSSILFIELLGLTILGRATFECAAAAGLVDEAAATALAPRNPPPIR